MHINRKIDVLVVRFLPFVIFIIMGIRLLCEALSLKTPALFILHKDSVIYPLALLVISLSNSKYHCVWNRTMYAFLILVPVVDFIDASIPSYDASKIRLIIKEVVFVIIAIITATMSIRHFIITKKHKKYGRKPQRRKIRL